MEAHTFELKTPYFKDGRSHQILARTDLMNVAIKYYNEGGENTLHTHPAEDHVFIVLDEALSAQAPVRINIGSAAVSASAVSLKE